MHTGAWGNSRGDMVLEASVERAETMRTVSHQEEPRLGKHCCFQTLFVTNYPSSAPTCILGRRPASGPVSCVDNGGAEMRRWHLFGMIRSVFRGPPAALSTFLRPLFMALWMSACQSQPGPTVCFFFFLNPSSNCAALNLTAPALWDAFKVHSWPGRNRKKSIFKGAFSSTFLCTQSCFIFWLKLTSGSLHLVQALCLSDLPEAVSREEGGRVWTPTESSGLPNQKGSYTWVKLQLHLATVST